jgi:hypothetical protein
MMKLHLVYILFLVFSMIIYGKSISKVFLKESSSMYRRENKFSLVFLEARFIGAIGIVQREYEYRIVTRQLYGTNERTGKDPSPISEGELNKYGQEGWQLCGLTNANWQPGPMSHRLPEVQLIFKRPKLIKRTQSG